MKYVRMNEAFDLQKDNINSLQFRGYHIQSPQIRL